MTPTSVAPGTTTTFTVTVKNNASPQSLGSLNFCAPSGFKINSLVSSPAGSTAQVVGNTIELSNLNLAAGSTAVFSFSATAGCTGSFSWTVEAKQSNDFSGPPGNDFGPLTTVGLTTTTTGGCHLVFSEEPEATAGTNTPIVNTSGPPVVPVEVEALDGNNNPIAGVSVTIVLSTNPTGATLSGGGAQVTNASGEASFSSLAINLPTPTGSAPYVLQANAAGFTSATSTGITVYQGDCTATSSSSTCSASAGSGSSLQTSTLSGAPAGTNLFVDVGVDSIPAGDCNDGSLHTKFVTTVSSSNAPAGSTKTLSITFQSKAGPGQYAVCYIGNDGTVIDPVPSCSSSHNVPPCLVSPISKDNTQSINEDLLLDGRDPRFG